MSSRDFWENRKRNQLEFEQQKVILKSKATSLVATLTTRCDINCIMCEEKQIPWDIPKKVLQEIKRLFPYLEQIIWQGGELLILDYFADLLEEAGKYPNLYQSFITNGLAITETVLPKLVHDNIELVISIDGVTKEMYEGVRKGAKFDKLLYNIHLINELRESTRLDNFAFRMHAVIMKANYEQIEEFVPFAKKLGFDALHLMPIWGNLNSVENIFYHNNKKALQYIKDRMPSVEKKAKECHIDLLNSLPVYSDLKNTPSQEIMGQMVEKNKELRSIRENLLCRMPWKRMVINPAGLVCPACHCQAMVGNVTEESLSSIWNNKKMQLYRKKIIAKDYWGFCNPDCINGIISEDLRGLKDD